MKNLFLAIWLMAGALASAQIVGRVVASPQAPEKCSIRLIEIVPPNPDPDPKAAIKIGPPVEDYRMPMAALPAAPCPNEDRVDLTQRIYRTPLAFPMVKPASSWLTPGFRLMGPKQKAER